jgi:hypothetical protein
MHLEKVAHRRDRAKRGSYCATAFVKTNWPFGTEEALLPCPRASVSSIQMKICICVFKIAVNDSLVRNDGLFTCEALKR